MSAVADEALPCSHMLGLLISLLLRYSACQKTSPLRWLLQTPWHPLHSHDGAKYRYLCIHTFPGGTRGKQSAHAVLALCIHSLSPHWHSSTVSLLPAILGRSTNQSSWEGEPDLHGKDRVRKKLDLRGKRAQVKAAQATHGGIIEGRWGGGSCLTSVRFGENSENLCYVL